MKSKAKISWEQFFMNKLTEGFAFQNKDLFKE